MTKQQWRQSLRGISWLVGFYNLCRLFNAKSIFIQIISSISNNRLIRLVGRVFANGPGDLGSIPGRVIQKLLKWYLIPTCLTLSNIRYVSMVKWSNPGKRVVPSRTLGVVAIEKGAILLPSTTLANFSYFSLLFISNNSV